MESWFPLAIVSAASALLWAWKGCVKLRARESAPCDETSVGVPSSPMGGARSKDELEEASVLGQGPPESWKRIFLDPQPQSPAYPPRLYSRNGERLTDAIIPVPGYTTRQGGTRLTQGP